MIEVEKKYWIRNKEELLAKLYKKAKFKKDSRKEDIYYINKNHSFNQLDHKKDKIFRLRFSENKYIVTFKEKVLKDGTEVNIEGEFEIADKKTFEDFANYIGFTLLVEKIKETKLFNYQGISLEYNYLHNLGYFFEAEIICSNESEVDQAIDKLNELFKDFGLDDRDLEKRMYIELLLERKGNEPV